MTDMNIKRLASAATGLALGAGVAFTFALGDPGPAPTRAAAVQTVAVPESHGWYRPGRIYPTGASPSVAVPRPVNPVMSPPAVASTKVRVAVVPVAPTTTAVASHVSSRVPKPAASKAIATTTTTVAPRPAVEMEYVYVVNNDICFEAQLNSALENHWTIVHPSDCYNGFYAPGGWDADHTGPADPCQGKPCPQPVEYPRP